MANERATMDFFGEQDTVKRKTFFLVVELFLAVAVIVAVTYVVVMCYWYVCNTIANFYRHGFSILEVEFEWWEPGTLILVGSVTCIVVLAASLYKMITLRTPIEYVMGLVVATPVNRDVHHPATKRFINVVEEMSIASKVPFPATYVMTREPGINALAVGMSPSNAAVAVTEGAINMLTRAELQGVVAHEFSHIFNGDMLLNVRLIGILHGIDFIGYAGRRVFDALIESGKTVRRGMDNARGLMAWVGLILCLPFMLVSWIGLTLGGLIRAAISRQREYLADASAVQFTRDPSGLAGALKKIAGLAAGSQILTASACYASHFFFAGSMALRFSTSTHPPLTRRIRKLEPGFDGQIQYVPSYYRVEDGKVEDAVWSPITAGTTANTWTLSGPSSMLDPEDIIESLGAPKADYVAHTDAVLGSVPSPVVDAARNPAGAEALICGLLLKKQEDVKKAQLERLSGSLEPAVFMKMQGIIPCLDRIAPEARLPLLDLATASLKQSSPQGYEKLEKDMEVLAGVDKAGDLSALVISRIVRRRLGPSIQRDHMKMATHSTMSAVARECMVLLSCVARAGKYSGDDAVKFCAEAGRKFGLGEEVLPEDACTPKALGDALDSLAHAKPHVKRVVLAACVICVSAGKTVTPAEAELLRAIGDSLGCSVPPIVPGRVR